MIPRLLVPGATPGDEVDLAADRAHYLLEVLRLRAGDPVEAFDGHGTRMQARLLVLERRRARLAIGAVVASPPDSPLRVTLAQGIAQGDRMDLVIEKATELGAQRIVPLLTERSLVRLDASRAGRRHAHWQRIVEAACMQCGRDALPAVDAPLGLADWLAADPDPGARRLLLSPTAQRTVRQAGIEPGRPLVVLVGPESGLSEAEQEQAAAAGFEPVRLGARILRTETAGLAALAALQAIAGDF